LLDFLDPRKVAAKKIARMAAKEYHSGWAAGQVDVVEEVTKGKGTPPKEAKTPTEPKTTKVAHDDFAEMFQTELDKMGVRFDK
jgi:hypothetical protein